MDESIVAVAGTLLGSVTAGAMSHLTTSRTERAARSEARRRDVKQAVEGLLAALVDHREQQYLKVAARRDGVSDTREARQARYAARSKVSHAVDALEMSTTDPQLLAIATAAVDATFAIGDASPADLKRVGDRARETHRALRSAGAKAVNR